MWIDSQFAGGDAGDANGFRERAADDTFRVVRAPDTRTTFKTWLQPDIYVGARIGVYDLRSGAYDRGVGAYLEWMIVGMNHRVENRVGYTTIRARYVPPLS